MGYHYRHSHWVPFFMLGVGYLIFDYLRYRHYA